MQFDLIDFVLKLQEIKYKKGSLFYPNGVKTEIRDYGITISAKCNFNIISLDIFLKVWKICEDFEINECLLEAYDGCPIIKIKKDLTVKENKEFGTVLAKEMEEIKYNSIKGGLGHTPIRFEKKSEGIKWDIKGDVDECVK